MVARGSVLNLTHLADEGDREDAVKTEAAESATIEQKERCVPTV